MKPQATLLIAALCVLIYVVLSLRVILVRFRDEQMAIDVEPDVRLQFRIRAHGNFAEYVPLALVMMGFLELSGAQTDHLYWIGALLIAARVAHAIGMPLKPPNPLRAFGIMGTLAVLIAESFYALALLR